MNSWFMFSRHTSLQFSHWQSIPYMFPRVVEIDSKGYCWVENHATISFTQCTIYIIPPVHKVCVQDSIRTHYQTMETLGHIFLARNRRNYANKALNLLVNINATLPNNVKLHTSSHTITRLTNKRIGSKLTKWWSSIICKHKIWLYCSN